MHNKLQRVVAAVAGIALALALYVVPDMVAVMDEAVSFAIKAVCAVLLMVIGIIAARAHKSAVAGMSLAAGIVLILLLAFGGTIRLSELGIM